MLQNRFIVPPVKFVQYSYFIVISDMLCVIITVKLVVRSPISELEKEKNQDAFIISLCTGGRYLLIFQKL